MIKTGIFTKTFARPIMEDMLDAVARYGLEAIQLNLDSADGADMPSALPDTAARRIRRAVENRGLEVAALSGTFNMIHSDEDKR